MTTYCGPQPGDTIVYRAGGRTVSAAIELNSDGKLEANGLSLITIQRTALWVEIFHKGEPTSIDTREVF